MIRAGDVAVYLRDKYGLKKRFPRLDLFRLVDGMVVPISIKAIYPADNGNDPSYAETLTGHHISAHYLFPSEPSLHQFKDDFGSFRDWACEGELT
jgi:hypothetical protein